MDYIEVADAIEQRIPRLVALGREELEAEGRRMLIEHILHVHGGHPTAAGRLIQEPASFFRRASNRFCLAPLTPLSARSTALST